MMQLLMKALAAGAMLFVLGSSAYGHGLIQNPPSRNWFCGAVTKPDQVLNGVAQYPICGEAFASDFTGGYSFMSVLTHAQGRAVVTPLPQNVCGFNSETWKGGATPWDQPINWPTTNMSPGSQTFSWNISWGPHYSDTQEFRYWITKPGFQFKVGQALTWNDFEETAFCSLAYDDSKPTANPSIIPDKAGAMFHTKCTVPQRQGRHVIYGEWGRNQYTYERFHSCVDVVFNGGPGFSLSASPVKATVVRGASTTTTVSITRTGGFTGAVAFTASGLPTGVSASFSPASATGGTTVLTLAASSSAAIGSATVTVTATSGSLTQTLPVSLDVAGQSDYSLGAAPTSLSVTRGGSTTSALTITRTNGFTGAVVLSATGLPAGVTATFNPASTTSGSSTLTLAASASAATGPATVTVTGTSGSLIRTTTLNVTVNPVPTGSFTLSSSPSSLNFARSGSAATTLSLARTGGFSAAVNFSASQLPSGITASFNPASTTGTSTTLTLAASSSAITGGGSMIVTATGGGVTQTLSVPFTVASTSGPSSGSLTVTPVINVNQPWYNEVAVRLNNTATITALTVTIKIQKTAGIGFGGQYNTVGGQIQQSNSSTGSELTYVYKLAAGQTLTAGGYRVFAAQASGAGTAHPTAGDTYTVTYTMGGTTLTENGHF